MTPDETRFVFCGFRRGGSSIFFELLQLLFHRSGKSTEDVNFAYNRRGVAPHDITHEQILEALDRNNLIGCFREVPGSLYSCRKYDIKPIIVVRDPRDCVVSWYAARRLHGDDLFVTFNEEESFDEYVRSCDPLLREQETIIEYASTLSALIFRYEDLVSSPAEFFAAVVDHVGFPIGREAIDEAMLIAAFQNIALKSDQHNRSGQPYLALRTLDRRILDYLNEKFGAVIRRFDYPLNASVLEGVRVPQLDRRELDSIKRYVMRLATENHYRIEDIHKLQEANQQLTRRVEEMAKELGLRNDPGLDSKN